MTTLGPVLWNRRFQFRTTPPWQSPVLEEVVTSADRPKRIPSGRYLRGNEDRAGQPVGYDRQGSRESLVGIKRRGIKQKSVVSRLERGYRSLAIARISLLQVLKDGLVYSRLTPPLQLFDAAAGALLNRSDDIKLNLCVRADHSSDIAPVQYCSRRRTVSSHRRPGEIALKLKQGCSGGRHYRQFRRSVCRLVTS
jgi:hypothetical protein